MPLIDKIDDLKFPFAWVNLDYLPDSAGIKKEIYLLSSDNIVEELIYLFHSLFGVAKNEILIFAQFWGDFCIETWDPRMDAYNYKLDGKSEEAQKYLLLLQESNIEFEFSGCAQCNNWDRYFSIILPCIVNHKAPYSPLFYDKNENFFFYFHHSGSIGLYYKTENKFIKQVLNKATEKYRIQN